ncbi:MAG: HAD family hydrolase [Chloroflexi bacterium]|nr:HAD family hydrolase [Chloroflexota bacterium]
MDTVVNGLVFDLDNTLLDRQTTFMRVAGNFYEEHLCATTSVTRDDAIRKIVQWDADGYANREKMFARWLGEWPEAGLDMGTLTKWYRSAMERQVQPSMEVNGFLAYLNDRQVPWGIVTNGSRNQHRKCRAAGLDQLAPFIIVSEEVGYAKPDPRIFSDALKATGLTGPEQIMFVGDNPIADIDGAKGFGMKVGWIRRGRQYPVDLQPPDHVFDFVTEVRHIVDMTPQSPCVGNERR